MSQKKNNKKIKTLILSIVPIAVGLLLVLRNLVASDKFNIGISLILLSVASILNTD